MILAHGGAAGAAAEIGVLLVPLAIFALFTWWARRHQPAKGDETGRGGSNEEMAS